MNPSSGEAIPPSAPEWQPSVPEAPIEQGQERALERESPSESAVGKHQPPVQSTPQPQTGPPAAATAPPKTTPDTPAATAGLAAADSDLMEKEWIESIKRIEKQTRDDPYKQKDEISKSAADYRHKRFKRAVPHDKAAGA